MIENRVYQAVNEYMDWLSEQSETYIRRIFADKRIPRNVDFIWEIGGTEYIVKSHFNQNAGESMFSKLIRLLENEIID